MTLLLVNLKVQFSMARTAPNSPETQCTLNMLVSNRGVTRMHFKSRELKHVRVFVCYMVQNTLWLTIQFNFVKLFVKLLSIALTLVNVLKRVCVQNGGIACLVYLLTMYFSRLLNSTL